MSQEWRRDGYAISTEASRLDLETVHDFLKNSYWAPGVPFEVVRRSVENSMAFGVYHGAEQVGFARVVTDRATFAYIADVFILEAHRGHGLGVRTMETVLSHPELQGLRRWMLATRDAHELYGRLGFDSLKSPGIFMEKKDASYGVCREPAKFPASRAAGSPRTRRRTSHRPLRGCGR